MRASSRQRRPDQFDAEAEGSRGDRPVKSLYLIRPSGEDKRKLASMKTPDSPEPLATAVLMN
jgi:hypothetical protein